MRYLLLSSWLIIFWSCKSVYKDLKPATANVSMAQRLKPNFTKALYKTQIEVVGHQLSGLLLIKTMPDSSVRVVFSNELGVKFFDFEFSERYGFRVLSIIKQMNKKAVVQTLRADMELILMRHLDVKRAYVLEGDSLLHFVFPQKSGFNHYVSDLTGTKLLRLERASKRKPIVVAFMGDYVNCVPDTIGITHKNFRFVIALKRIEQ